jgi:DNA-binding Xre family transcriptional regulator
MARCHGEVEYTNEFGDWWDELGTSEQDAVDVVVGLLQQRRPGLAFPFSSGAKGSRHSQLRVLRVQHRGRPYRILYAFDPRRTAIVLLGGDKTSSTTITFGRSSRRVQRMAKKFSELRARMSEERRARNAERTAALAAAIDLAELRGALDLTQEELAERLEIAQSNVSRLENRDDMLISTLRQVVEAVGGELHLEAVFPDGDVRLRRLEKTGV